MSTNEFMDIDTNKLYKKIFPCAIIFTRESIEGICKNLFGAYPDNIWISDAISDAQKMFRYIKEITDTALRTAFLPFMEWYKVDLHELMKQYHYNYQDLFTIALYHTLERISDAFSLPEQARVKDSFDNLHQQQGYKESDKNNYRVAELSKQNRERNDAHLKYFGIEKKYKMHMKSNDVAYYDFLFENRVIKNFLYNDEVKINSHFLKYLIGAYKYIDNETGFYRFSLDYRLECDAKFDFLTHMLYALHNLYTRKTLDKEKIYRKIHQITNLCNLKDYEPCVIKKLLDYKPSYSINAVYGLYYRWMAEIEYNNAFTNRTINFVTIGLYDMYDYFEKQQGNLKAIKCIQNALDELKAILYAVSQFVSSIIVGMLIHFYDQSENLKKYSYRDIIAKSNDMLEYIDQIKGCETAIVFFDNAINKYNKRLDYRLITKVSSYHLLLDWLNYIYKS